MGTDPGNSVRSQGSIPPRGRTWQKWAIVWAVVLMVVAALGVAVALGVRPTRPAVDQAASTAAPLSDAPPQNPPRPSAAPAVTSKPTAKPSGSINSFEECARARYPVAESHPEQCRGPDGRVFIRSIPPTGSSSGVRGTVLFGPVCPVERFPPDPACAPRPGAASLSLTRPDGSTAAQTRAGDDGRFEMQVPPGPYTLQAQNQMKAQIGSGCGRVEVLVSAGTFSEVIVSCDTGIR